MTPVFADASYYVALLSPRDQHHRDALRISGELRQAVVVTEFVLIEVSKARSTTNRVWVDVLQRTQRHCWASQQWHPTKQHVNLPNLRSLTCPRVLQRFGQNLSCKNVYSG